MTEEQLKQIALDISNGYTKSTLEAESIPRNVFNPGVYVGALQTLKYTYLPHMKNKDEEIAKLKMSLAAAKTLDAILGENADTLAEEDRLKEKIELYKKQTNESHERNGGLHKLLVAETEKVRALREEIAQLKEQIDPGIDGQRMRFAAKNAELMERLNELQEENARVLYKLFQASATGLAAIETRDAEKAKVQKLVEHLKKITAPEPDGFGEFVADEFTQQEVLDARKFLSEYHSTTLGKSKDGKGV